MTGEDDRRFMAAALRLARRGLGLARPNPSVGCLIVRHEAGGAVIVGRGVTAAGGRPHAEANALREAEEAARGATAYVTLEPCSHIGRAAPCAEALVKAGVARVVCALDDPDSRVSGRGFAMLEAAGIEITRDVLRHQALDLHRGHLARIAFGRPHVTLKLALSRDGKLGLPGKRVAITGERANAYVHRLRSLHDAIAVGVDTVLSDDPRLNVRLPGLAARSPLIAIFDSMLRLPLTSTLFRAAGKEQLHCLARLDAPPERIAALEQGATIHLVPPPWLVGEGVNLDVALRELGKIGVTTLLLEGGLRLARAFLARDLVDEIVLLRGEGVLGDEAIAALDPGPLGQILSSGRFEDQGRELFGPDEATYYRRRR